MSHLTTSASTSSIQSRCNFVPPKFVHSPSCPIRQSRTSLIPSRVASASLSSRPSSGFNPQGSSVVTRATPSAAADTAEPTVEEIMVPHPIVFTETMSVKDAARIMVQKDISGAPVVDSLGNLVGILSESDLMWKGAGAPADHFIIPPIFIGAFDAMVYLRDNKAIEEELHKLLAKTVGEAMTRDPISVSPSAPMSEATKLMLNRKVNRLPVVEANGKVVGVITRHDVLRGLISSHSPFLE